MGANSGEDKPLAALAFGQLHILRPILPCVLERLSVYV
jgi:hypothetical protein